MPLLCRLDDATHNRYERLRVVAAISTLVAGLSCLLLYARYRETRVVAAQCRVAAHRPGKPPAVFLSIDGGPVGEAGAVVIDAKARTTAASEAALAAYPIGMTLPCYHHEVVKTAVALERPGLGALPLLPVGGAAAAIGLLAYLRWLSSRAKGLPEPAPLRDVEGFARPLSQGTGLRTAFGLLFMLVGGAPFVLVVALPFVRPLPGTEAIVWGALAASAFPLVLGAFAGFYRSGIVLDAATGKLVFWRGLWRPMVRTYVTVKAIERVETERVPTMRMADEFLVLHVAGGKKPVKIPCPEAGEIAEGVEGAIASARS